MDYKASVFTLTGAQSPWKEALKFNLIIETPN